MTSLRNLMPAKWELESSAGKIIDTLGDKDFPDGRFRPGTLNGQLAAIYLDTKKEIGIKLKKKDLIALWEDHYKKVYERIAIEKEHIRLQRLAYSADKALRKFEKEFSIK